MRGASVTKHIIGICGKRRSGKDVVASHLVSKYSFVNCKIAEKLKKMCQLLFNFTDEDLELTKDEINSQWQISPRQAMQFVGTEVMQFEIQNLLPGIKRNFWIKTMLDSNFGSHERIVISDLRFLHEVEAIKQCIADNNSNTKLTIIRLNRCRTHVHAASHTDDHVSEQECDLIEADHIIDNAGCIDSLLIKIDKLMASAV